MDRWKTLNLIKREISISPIGEQIINEVKTKVFGLVSSVSSDEWFAANREGINSKYRIEIYSFEYKGQEYVEMDGVIYKVYRTWEKGFDKVELYLEQKVGED